MLRNPFKSLFSRHGKASEQALAALALAKDLQRKGEPREAIAAYRQALDGGAPAADIHLQLGVLHAGLSEHEGAIEHLEKAIVRAPDDADALCMLGTVMNDLRRFAAATALFERALALRPNFREVLEDYRSLLEEVRGRVDIHAVVPFDAARHPLVARTYKRPIYVAQAPIPEGPLVNPEPDFRGIEELPRRQARHRRCRWSARARRATRPAPVLPREHDLEQHQARIFGRLLFRRILLRASAAHRAGAARAPAANDARAAPADDVGL